MLAGLVVLIATSAGALAVLLLKKLDGQRYAFLLAFSGGVMAFSAVEMLTESHHTSGDIGVLAGFMAGVAILMISERLLPHIHMHIKKKELTDSKKKAALIAGTIALHNIPEGLAIATAFASSAPLGWFVTTSIALQDIPEGALVSAPLAVYGVNKRDSLLYGILSGFAECVAAIAGFLFLNFFSNLVPVALAFSAGAMVYVVFVELLPDAMQDGKERIATISFIAGAAIAFVIAGALAV